jgi:manganese efflux pump family protein
MPAIPRFLRAILLALILPVTAALVAGCGAAGTTEHATTQSCFAYGVRALQRHETVTRVPPACAGLSREQVNTAVGRALRDVVGPLAKAPFRRRALAESRYLAGLVRSIPTARQRAHHIASAPPATTSLPASLAALTSWLVTAAAGLYLLTGWLTRTRSGRPRIRAGGPPPAVIGAHASFGLAGLAIWIAYMATREPALGWIAVGTTFLLAGLGMATLLTAAPDTERSGPLTADATAASTQAPDAIEAGTATASTPTASTATISAATASPRTAGARPPVLVIALHGVLATITILLVLLAVIGAG